MIELRPLKNAHAKGGLESNEAESSLMAQSGHQFAQAVQMLLDAAKSGGPWLPYVQLPCMHQSIELLTKSLILVVDVGAKPTSIGHDALNAMRSYSEAIPVFGKILHNQDKVAHIGSLQRAYTSMRNAEDYFCFSGRDVEQCLAIAEQLMDAYFVLTKS